ncbi:MAG: diaminopimelate epimerase [Chloroflexi bacterium]|nr:diaminopimelate epimerase [Chloroflexota bacterium]
MDFTKMQASGNDFVIVRETDAKRDWTELAQRMCHRRFGIGADGVLVVLPSRKADFRVRVINSDGSEAEICGNGLISLGRYAAETGLVKPKCDEATIETLAGIKRLKLLECDGVEKVRVGMGAPHLEPSEIPVMVQVGEGYCGAVLDYPLFVGNRKLPLSFASMGNPHAVMFTTKPLEDFPLTRVGPVVENHPIFPNRVNFEVARVIERNRIEAKVWERGAGETLACGSGACAIAVTARLHGYIDGEVDIALPGGTLTVEWDGKGEVVLTGAAKVVFTGNWCNNGG